MRMFHSRGPCGFSLVKPGLPAPLSAPVGWPTHPPVRGEPVHHDDGEEQAALFPGEQPPRAIPCPRVGNRRRAVAAGWDSMASEWCGLRHGQIAWRFTRAVGVAQPKLSRGSGGRAFAFDMLPDEIVHTQAAGSGAAVIVVALEIDGVPAGDDLARFAEQEAVHLERIRGPGVEDDAVAFEAVGIGEAGAALDPRLGIVAIGQGPAEETLHLVFGIGREPVMLAIDLPDENA